MSYIWENYNVDKTYKLATTAFSPYMEVFCCSQDDIRVNILYRFIDIYSSIADEKEFDYNLLFHLLANIDFYSGITNKEIWMMQARDQIENYGVKKSLFGMLKPEHQYILLSYLYIRHKESNRYCRFFDFLTEIFDVKLFYSDFFDTYIVYVKCAEATKFKGNGEYTAGQLYEIAKDMLCDFWLDVEVYWDVSFGIIGDRMEVDNTIII